MPRRKKLDLDGRCDRCLQQVAHCACALIPTIPSATHFLIIRHWKERRKPSNTGRLVDYALPNSMLVDYGAPGETWDPSVLDLTNAALLFPSEHGPRCTVAPDTVVVIDGSWPQARKLVNKLPGLKELPRLTVAPHGSDRTRLRTPPIANGVSTIEAVASALDWIDGPSSGEPLRTLYDRIVKGAVAARGRPLHR
jgi:DTW domain-containing protein YfiP